jgi:hypothetical protein
LNNSLKVYLSSFVLLNFFMLEEGGNVEFITF